MYWHIWDVPNPSYKYVRNEAVIKRFGENVRHWRNQKGYSQEELANRINIGIAHPSTIAQDDKGSKPAA